MPVKEGSRVTAFFESTIDTVYVFGNGVYEGKEIPPSNIKMMGLSVTSATPKIRLDNCCKQCNKPFAEKDGEKAKCPACGEEKNLLGSKIVWGCECWSSPEDQMAKEIAGRKVVVLDIEEQRNKVSKKKIPVAV